MAGMSGGEGGMSNSSSAASRSGDAGSGSGSVNVGGFNPPAYNFGGGNGQVIALGIVGVLVLIYFLKKK